MTEPTIFPTWMRRSGLMMVVLVTPLFSTACTDAPDEPVRASEVAGHGEHLHGDAQADSTPDAYRGEAVAATVEDGAVQTIDVEATLRGFQPNEIQLRADMPVLFTVTRTSLSECLQQIQIPAFDVGPVDLPMDEPVTFRFTPNKNGTFEFVCGMGMQTGTIVVESQI